MIKEELRKLRTLRATPKMMQMAKNDKKEMRTITTHWSDYQEKAYEYSLFMRCQTLHGYLKVAIFLPQQMRCGSNMPAYEIFLHKDAKQYLTWDAGEQKWLTAMIDNLPFNWYGGHHTKRWINPEGAQTIKHYLDVSQSGYAGISEWQRKVHDEQVEARYKRMTDLWDADQALVPELPEDWGMWVRRNAVREWFVFYETGSNHGHCTYCDAEVPIASAKHNKKTVCTCCGNNVTYKNTNRVKYVETKRYRAFLMQKVRNGMVIRNFTVEIAYRKDKYWTPIIIDRELRRAFYDQQAHHRESYNYELFRNRELRFCKADTYYIGWGSPASGTVYKKTLPGLYRTVLKHTGYSEFRKKGFTMNPERYMTVWNRYPQVELLLKAQLPKLTTDCIANYSDLQEVINLQIPGSLAKKMHLDEWRLKRLRMIRGGMRALRWLRHEKKTGQMIPDEVIQWMEENEFAPQSFHFIREKMRVSQIYNYLIKQMEISGMKAREMLVTWEDTVNMSIRGGKNMRDPYNYKPPKLKQRHDELVLQAMMEDLKAVAEKNKKDHPQVEPVLASIKEIFSYTGEEYCVIVPETILDIMIEGQRLAHCVVRSTRYLDRIEQRESYILFLRKTAAPDESYYTLEVEPDATVRQKRTFGDDQLPDIEDATQFLKQWQKEVSKRLTEQDRELARRSKQLRLEGFEQMRRDHVVIRTGDLRGKLLVDVLMADLMENKEEKTA